MNDYLEGTGTKKAVGLNEEAKYFKDAFMTPGNLVFVGVSAFLSLVAAGLGAWPLALVPAAAEGVYLFRKTRSEEFRRKVRMSGDFSEGLHSSKEREEKAFLLKGEGSARYRRFCKNHRDIIESVAKMQNEGRELFELSLERVDGLCDAYLDLLLAIRRCEDHLARTSEKALSAEREKILKEIGAAPPEAREIHEKSLALLDERVEHRVEVAKELPVLRARMEMMENAVALMRDKAATVTTPVEIDSQVELVLSNMDDARTLASRMESLLLKERPR